MNKEILYDYPVSYLYRSYEAELNGETLPHIEPEEKPPQDVEVRYIHHNVNDTRRVFAKLNALDGAVKYLLSEKQAGKRKKPSSYFLKKVSNIRGEGGGG